MSASAGYRSTLTVEELEVLRSARGKARAGRWSEATPEERAARSREQAYEYQRNREARLAQQAKHRARPEVKARNAAYEAARAANARTAISAARVPLNRCPNRPPELIAALDAEAVAVARYWGSDAPAPKHWRAAANYLGGLAGGQWEGHPALTQYPVTLSQKDARRWAGCVNSPVVKPLRESLHVETGIHRVTSWPRSGRRISWQATVGSSAASFPTLAQARGWRVLALEAIARGEVPRAAISRSRKGEARILAAAPDLPEPILPEPVNPAAPKTRGIGPRILAAWEAHFPGRPYPGT
jgi:hypothetical protein